MIRKMQFKFIAVAMLVVVLVFAVVFASLNISMKVRINHQTDRFLEELIRTEAFLPDFGPGMEPDPDGRPDKARPFPAQPAEFGRYFYLKLDSAGTVIESGPTAPNLMFDMDETEMQRYADQVRQAGQMTGKNGQFRYRIEEKPYGFMVVSAEISMASFLLQQLTYMSVLITIGFCVPLFILVFLVSRWLVRPIQKTVEKQRRFISDASHELKTPITIISANADMLETEIGENRWLTHIKEQSDRMSHLVQDLLLLARMDETRQSLPKTQVDLTDAVTSTTLEFESVVFEQRKQLQYEIEEKLFCQGDPARIRQVVTILLDNAVKHTEPGGLIHLTLKRENMKNVLSVYNTGEGVAPEDRERIFERFYRSDESRSRETGGSGLGLSIARAIVTAHGGRIAVTSGEGKWTRFTVTLP